MYKAKDIYDFLEGMAGLLEVEVGAGTAYKIQKNYNIIATEYEIIDKIRETLLKEHGDGEFSQSEFAKLLEEEVDIKLTRIKLSELSQAVTTPRNLGLIEELIIDDTGEEEEE